MREEDYRLFQRLIGSAMDAQLAYELARLNSNMSDVERLVSLYWGLTSTLRAGVPGDVVEVGCNAGYTSVWLQTAIRTVDPVRKLVLFDSFEGMPNPGPDDMHLPRGECRATQGQVVDNFTSFGLPLPKIVPGWFDATLSRLSGQICFGYIDSDHYASILTSLKHVWPRLSSGGLLMIDDYCDKSRNARAWDGLPGVRKACEEFFSPDLKVEVIAGTEDLSLGYIYKPGTA
jgi:O-methyltransferase